MTETITTRDLPTEVIVALCRDLQATRSAMAFAYAEYGDVLWMVAVGRPNVLPGPPQVMSYDPCAPLRERHRDRQPHEIPTGLDWEPWHTRPDPKEGQ